MTETPFSKITSQTTHSTRIRHETPICEESGALPADYSYVTPWDGVTHYVSGEHYRAVVQRFEALGLINIAGGLEPDRVVFTAVARPRPAAERIDWMALARQYQGEAEAVSAALRQSEERRLWAEGEIAVRERRIADLQEELSQIRHLLKM